MRSWIFLFIHTFFSYSAVHKLSFLLLLCQTSIAIFTTFFVKLKSWRRSLQPKRAMSTFMTHSSNFEVVCFFNFSWYIYIYIYIDKDIKQCFSSPYIGNISPWRMAKLLNCGLEKSKSLTYVHFHIYVCIYIYMLTQIYMYVFMFIFECIHNYELVDIHIQT